MKQNHIVLLVILLVGLMAAPAVHAGDGAGLPDTAVEAVTLLVSALAALWGGGHLGNLFTDQLKKVNFGLLAGQDKAKLGGLLAEIAALLLSTGSAYILSQFLVPLAEFLDQNQLYPILLAAWPVGRQAFLQRKELAQIIEVYDPPTGEA